MSGEQDLDRALAELGFELGEEERAIVEARLTAQLETMQGLLEWTPPDAAAGPGRRLRADRPVTAVAGTGRSGTWA